MHSVPETLPESHHQRTIYYGAAPAPRSLIIEARERLKAELAQSYGLTEATQCVTILTPEDHRRAITSSPELLLSCGKPVAHTAVRILVNSTLEDTPHRVGEVVVFGPQVMIGYWQRPTETANVFFEGWLRTGDVGYLDADGYLYITDRLKDLVISGGENVYTPRVEDVIRSHPAVREVAVIGLPHPKWGETVHAVIALNPSYQPSEQLAGDIVRHCRQFLGGFEIPRSIEFTDQLPKTATGKILKRNLRSRQITDIHFALNLRDSIGTARLHSREGGTE
jgi:acyl-CoA synthetase (AMP-forming)/AMP-acid ligase II